MAEGSQTFEEDIARMVTTGIVDRREGLAFADSPTNLVWRLQNDFAMAAKAAAAVAAAAVAPVDDGPSFTDITLDVKH